MFQRGRRSIEALFGACLIYSVMAACNGGGNATSGGHGHGGQGHGGASVGGAMAGPGGSDGSGILDALTDPVPDAMADPSSGSRLKAAWIESTDGAKQFLLNTEIDYGNGATATANVWYDSMRDETCTIRLASDGKLRCLPSFPQAVPANQTTQVFFGDATCSSVAYIVINKSPMNCPPWDPQDYALLIVEATTTCQMPGENGRYRVFKRGNPVTLTPAIQLYSISGPVQSNQCSAGPSSDQFAGVWAANEVDISQFAEFKTTVKHDP
jgi:hypothetical protein